MWLSISEIWSLFTALVIEWNHWIFKESANLLNSALWCLPLVQLKQCLLVLELRTSLPSWAQQRLDLQSTPFAAVKEDSSRASIRVLISKRVHLFLQKGAREQNMDQIGWLCYLATGWNSPESWHYRRPFGRVNLYFLYLNWLYRVLLILCCNFFNKPDEINGEEPVVQVNHQVQSMKSIVLLPAKLSKIWVYRQIRSDLAHIEPPRSVSSCNRISRQDQ